MKPCLPRLPDRLRNLLPARAWGLIAGTCCVTILLVFLGSWAIDRTSSTAFCISCHEMEAPGREAAASLHGRNRSGYAVGCADCHITPGLVGLVRAKWRGLGELYVHYTAGSRLQGAAWEERRQELRRKLAREIPQENCTRCHDLERLQPSTREGQVAHKAITPEMRCLDCHSVEGLRRLVHDPPS